ncbi:MAG TPA: NEW3 domain-containing protein [Candidatus Limnocylindrales bacterium]
MRALTRTVLASTLALVCLSGLGSTALAAGGLTVTVPYPGVVVGPGSKVTFNVTIKTTTAGRVDLSLNGVPSGWTAYVRGGGTDITAVQTNGKDPVTATVEITVPADATGTKEMTLHASGLGETVDTTLDVQVQASAAGDVTFTTDVPSQKGSSTQTFTFNLTINNTTAQDLTFSVNAQGPDGWTVNSTLTGSSSAASAIVKAGETSSVTVTANPPDGVAAGQYPINVTATAGAKQVQAQLGIEITGSYTLAMSTPNQVLSNSGGAGSATTQQLTLTNSGTSDLTNVSLQGTGPTNWKFAFDQSTIASIPAGQTVTVNATITPSSDAIAGDYQLTFTATGDNSTSATQTIRFTVQTSILGGLVGIGLVIVVLIALWFVFRRYGRR